MTKTDLKKLRDIFNMLEGNDSLQQVVADKLSNKKTTSETVNTEQANNSNINNSNINTPNINKADLLQKMGGVTTGNPLYDMAIKVGLEGISQTARAVGSSLQNNGNQLAAALLASKRTSQRKEDKYGKTLDSVGKEIAATERVRKGNNAKIAADAVANTVSKINNVFSTPLDMVNMLSATASNPLPGHAYQYMNGAASRADRATRAFNK